MAGRPEYVVVGQLHDVVSDQHYPPPADAERSVGFWIGFGLSDVSASAVG